MRQITTRVELGALLHAVGEHAEAAIVREPSGRPWLIAEDDGDFWATSYSREDDDGIARVLAAAMDLPLTVLYRPDEPQRPCLPDPKGGCSCTPHSEDHGTGYVETLVEYDPACPEHSEHVYNPRTGIWEHAETQRVQPSREAIRDALATVWDDHEAAHLIAGPREHCAAFAHAVVELLAAQSTVAEVRAQALRDAAKQGISFSRGAAIAMHHQCHKHQCRCGNPGSEEFFREVCAQWVETLRAAAREAEGGTR